MHSNATGRVLRRSKPGMPDATGERTRLVIGETLSIETGAVRSGKLFTIVVPLGSDEFERFAAAGLCEAPLHEFALEGSSGYSALPGFSRVVVVARHPGVTDDEGFSAQRVLFDLFPDLPRPSGQAVFSQDVFWFENPLTDAEIERISSELLGNPLINRFWHGSSLAGFDYVPDVELPASSAVERIDLDRPMDELVRLSEERLWAFTREEIEAVKAGFADSAEAGLRAAAGLDPMPTDCEIEIIAQTWSEHCKHKEFAAAIDCLDPATGLHRTVDSLFKTFIVGSTTRVRADLEAAGEDWIVKVFSDNAGLVRIDEKRMFAFKVETHNTPSALDPYGGSLTGIVGVNRDPMGTGRGGARLLFNTDVLCFAPPDYSGPLHPGQLHPARIMAGVVKGIEDGGNKSGIPTVNGSVVFDDRYRGKPLVYCGTGAILRSDYPGEPSWEKPVRPGCRIYMAGGRVGRDGIHGATFSSGKLDEKSPRTAVQIGSPITQKLMSDFLERACAEGLVLSCTDDGAGGLSSSIGELARPDNPAQGLGGAVVHLDRVPLKYPGLKPWEIFVSESQERMTLCIEPEKARLLEALAKRFEVEITDIGEFTDTGRLDIRWNGARVAWLGLDFLHEGLPRKHMEAELCWPGASEKAAAERSARGGAAGNLPSARAAGSSVSPSTRLPPDFDWNAALKAVLSRPNVCSKEGIVRRYDHEVKGRTVLKPLSGLSGNAPQDAGVVRVDLEGWGGIAVSNGIAPKYADVDPYASSAGAFDEAVRQIVSVGGELPLLGSGGFWSVNDNFCVPDSAWDPVGNPDGKKKLGALVRMCEALYDASTAYSIPLTSGKDSMKNDFRAGKVKISVPPTVLYSAAAAIADVRKIVTAEFKKPGDIVYLVGKTRDELGFSEFSSGFGLEGGTIPQVRFVEARGTYTKMMKAHRRGYLASSHDCSDGGLAVTLAECCFGGSGAQGPAGSPSRYLGAAIDLDALGLEPGVALFSESHSRFVVSVIPEKTDLFENLMGESAFRLGIVTDAGSLVVEAPAASSGRPPANDAGSGFPSTPGGHGFPPSPLIDIPVSDLVASWKSGPGGASW